MFPLTPTRLAAPARAPPAPLPRRAPRAASLAVRAAAADAEDASSDDDVPAVRAGGGRGGGRGGRGGRGGGGRGGDRGDRRSFDEAPEFTERVVQVSRVTKVVKGGKQLAFRAVVVVGDEKGRVSCVCEERRRGGGRQKPRPDVGLFLRRRGRLDRPPPPTAPPIWAPATRIVALCRRGRGWGGWTRPGCDGRATLPTTRLGRRERVGPSAWRPLSFRGRFCLSPLPPTPHPPTPHRSASAPPPPRRWWTPSRRR